MGLLQYLKPDLALEKITDLTLADVRRMGVRALLLDLDNTLAEWRSREVDPEVGRWVAEAKENGLLLCICSNSSRPWRVRSIAEKLGVDYLPLATKPHPRSVRRAAERLNVTAQEAAVVGDQIFTDILGGRLAGARTVWVRPISSREFFVTRLVRIIEGWVVRMLRKRGLWPTALPASADEQEAQC